MDFFPEWAERTNGWLVAAVSGLLNLLFLTWCRVSGGRATRVEARVEAVEAGKASQEDLSKHTSDCDKRHDELVRDVRHVYQKLDETRREIKTDINMVAGLIRDRKE